MKPTQPSWNSRMRYVLLLFTLLPLVAPAIPKTCPNCPYQPNSYPATGCRTRAFLNHHFCIRNSNAATQDAGYYKSPSYSMGVIIYSTLHQPKPSSGSCIGLTSKTHDWYFPSGTEANIYFMQRLENKTCSAPSYELPLALDVINDIAGTKPSPSYQDCYLSTRRANNRFKLCRDGVWLEQALPDD